MDKIAFIVRGTLKKPDKFRANVTRYFQGEFEIYLKFTRRGGHAMHIVQELLQQGIKYLVAVGGDGTISEVINGYMLTPAQLRNNVVLAAFPRGAGNDFARSAGQITSMEHLYNVIKSGKVMPVDIIKATYNEKGIEQTRYYDNSFDIGLGAVVCSFVNKSGKAWGSNLTYYLGVLKSFILFKRIPVKVSADNFTFEGKVLELVVNNGKYYGSGLAIAPDAKIDDGLANVTIARKVNILGFILSTPRLRKCKRLKLNEVFYFTTKECTIESPHEKVPIEFDGEVTGSLPLKITVLKHAATFVKV